MREETTAIFFLGLCGRLAFAGSIARFRVVLLENASHTAVREGTGMNGTGINATKI